MEREEETVGLDLHCQLTPWRSRRSLYITIIFPLAWTDDIHRGLGHDTRFPRNTWLDMGAVMMGPLGTDDKCNDASTSWGKPKGQVGRLG